MASNEDNGEDSNELSPDEQVIVPVNRNAMRCETNSDASETTVVPGAQPAPPVIQMGMQNNNTTNLVNLQQIQTNLNQQVTPAPNSNIKTMIGGQNNVNLETGDGATVNIIHRSCCIPVPGANEQYSIDEEDEIPQGEAVIPFVDYNYLKLTVFIRPMRSDAELFEDCKYLCTEEWGTKHGISPKLLEKMDHPKQLLQYLEKCCLLGPNNLEFLLALMNLLKQDESVTTIEDFKDRHKHDLLPKSKPTGTIANGKVNVEVVMPGNLNLAKVSDVDRFKQVFSERLNVPKSAVNYAGCGSGSIILVFLLPVQWSTVDEDGNKRVINVLEMLQAAVRNRAEWLLKEGIIGVHIEGQEYVKMDDCTQELDVSVRGEGSLLYDISEDDDDFGQKLPPLHIYLKRVLDKYPEGGQIIKELIQNADDAGATRVIILHDKIHHQTNSMWSESLHDFNGPSLFVYNDATFQQQDWKNIQHPEQSDKMDDPTKVGRFGLGFISVYHMTDIPSILSGNQIGFLDPHEKFFVFDPHTRVPHKGKRGKKWRLSAEILDRFPDQFNPYLEPLFNCSRESFENGSFDGTLFRFPLRNSTESQVSRVMYDDNRVQSLFQSYQADAEISLLFLKNVESVTLYEKTSTTETPKLVFRVEIPKAKNIRYEREQFLTKIMQPIDIKSIYRMDITKEVLNDHEIQTTCNNYLTMNIVKREGISRGLKELVSDKDLGLLPWVGVSMLVNGNETDDIDGRVFCFLPLPESERTGLPIHVHGYFGLGDNRRSIKWPDRESEHDKAAKWNKLLVHDVFPDAYNSLILNAISQGLPADDVYRSWPDVSTLNAEWEEGVQGFLSRISTESVLYSNAEGSKGWKKPGEVLIDPLNDDLIQTLLERKGLPVARIPENVKRSLEWGGIKTKAVTPTVVRQSIRRDPLSWMDRENKLRILQYILQDDYFTGLYEQQIHLLPLADDSFTLFTSGSSSASCIYIANDDISQDLFPHMCSRFLAKDAPKELHKAVGYTQLTKLTANMVPNVLKEALPRDWIHGNNLVHWSPGGNQQPDMQWMERIWKWLTVHATSVPLETLSSVSLIPLDVSTESCRLARIGNKKIILRQQPTYGSSIPESMCTYLESLGAIVLRDNLPDWLAQHPQIDTFIKRPDVNGFMEVLESCWSTNAVTNIGTGGDALRKDIRHFFAHAALNDRYKRLLCQLPIFNTTDGCQASVKQVNYIVPNGLHGIPVQRLSKRFLLESDESDRLAIDLGACRVSESALLSKHILPDVENGFYNSDEITRAMLWVLDRPTYDANVKTLTFVPTGDGVCRPTELFTPDDQYLMTLFRNKRVFPTGVYASGRPLHCLKRLGLRDLSSVTATEVLMVSVDVSQSHDYDKARALLNHITDYPHLLGEMVYMNRINKPLGKFLRDKSWVPCEKDRPNDYPNTLKWCGNGVTLCRPDEAAIFDDWAFLLGSIKPMVKVQRKIPEFQIFDWESPNANKYHIVEQVMRHLRNASSCTQDPRYVRNMTTLVDAIYGFLNQVPSQYLEQIVCDVSHPLVWHGCGFTTADKIAFSKGTVSVNLAPYLHVLSPAIAQYRNFLKAIGVKDQFGENALNDVLHIIQTKHQQQKDDTADFSTDLKLVCDILNSIIALATPDCSFSNVLVPCRRGSKDPENCLTMTISGKCLYVDEERLLEYYNGNCELPVVHEMVPNQTAKRLGLRPLSHSVAPVDNIDLGYDIEGPHQSTVNAIKRNLDMYKEGLDIFKELIQNADDAGATEVKFLIDWRDNSANMSSLMNEGMRMCHGPALWAYNNATFSDDDVKNICSIAAANKKDQLDKIGRFGLGFTSVYHITDVPSLVSGPFVLIFDPRTNHLGNRINPGQPGIKLDLRNESHRRTVKSYPDQFQPFQGIFNCDLSSASNRFDKTLFRLPLRTQREAEDVSEEFLTKSVYNSQDEMTKMVIALKESAPSLLLFTQNVTNVSIQTLSSNGASTNPSDYETLLEISAETVKTLPRCIDSQENKNAQRKILHATQEYMETPSRPVPETTTVVKVTSKAMITKQSGKKTKKTTEHMFVVSSCMVTGRLVEMATSSEGQRACVLPCGGVAVELGSGKEGRVPTPFGINGTPGGAFSYLPLNVDTGLPFHVNGNFLLQPNRRQLWSKSSSAAKVKQGGEFETRWNIGFMEDVICKATINLLEDLQFLHSEDFLNAAQFQLLWPIMTHTESDFYPVVHSFYKYLFNVDSTKSANLIYNGNRWVSIHSCFFIEGSICSEPGNAIQSVLNQHLHPKKLVTLQEDVLQTIAQVDVGNCVREKTYDLRRFLREVYFPKIGNEEDIRTQEHNMIMLHLLDLRIGPEKRTEFDSELRSLECFPALPSGEELISPDRLIHPNKPIGQLFKEKDGRFPYGEGYRREERLLSLSELGMSTHYLGWDDIIDRAESFTTDDSYENNIQKCIILLKLMDKQLLDDEIPDSSQKDRLQNAPFLPVLTKPYNYPMELKDPSSPFMASAELFNYEFQYLIGSIHAVFDERCLGVDEPSSRVKSLLGIGNRDPHVVDVIKQLREVVKHVKPVNAVTICNEIYTFLNHLVIENMKSEGNIDVDNCMEELKEINFVLVEDRFLRCNQLAFDYKHRGDQYLYAVPPTLLHYKPLLSACGVKETFSFDDYLNVIQRLKQNNTSKALPDTDVSIAEDMLRAIVSLAESDNSNNDRVYALDCENILRPISELTYKDMPWLELNTVKEEMNFTHKSITATEAGILGIRTLRQMHRTNCSSRQGFQNQFGQREELTTRLKSILKDYSQKADVLKELLQNADDAGATEIHIVYDPRRHKGTKVVGQSWETMHSSPAICVYNNKPFTESDIEGIQNVGVGGKISDATTTGRFGIGFNSVYHLTDCPTLLSHNQKLCIFDPHVKYIPDATDRNPGMLYSLQGPNGCLATFPDMISGYLGEYKEFDLDKGTVFRFPLRTSASDSLISSEAYNHDKVQKLFLEFQHVARESILFLNSIRKISISEIDEKSQSLKTKFWIEAEVSKEAIQYRNDLRDLFKRLRALTDKSVHGISQQNWVYDMTIEDSENRVETWLVSQSFGVDIDEDKGDVFDFNAKDYLPHGAVAALLQARQSTDPSERMYKAFTFLPLPIYTGLPVHVNGTFELDQKRRNLVKGNDSSASEQDGKSLIQKWNRLLAEHVIGPAYAKLIHAAGRKLLNTDQDHFWRDIRDKQALFNRLFPANLCDLRDEWELVARSMLMYIGNNSLDVLPVIKYTNNTDSSITWQHPVSKRSEAFFDNLSDQLQEKKAETLRSFLLEIGFNLVSIPTTVWKCFIDAGVAAESISPHAVLNYLAAHSEQIADAFPCEITETKFKDPETLEISVKYCLKEAGTPSDLNGIPFRLTSDGILDKLSFDNTVYVTHFAHILPRVPQLFIHPLLVDSLMAWTSNVAKERLCFSSGMFKEFTLTELGLNLHEHLPTEWRNCSNHIHWSPGRNQHPSQEWLQNLWKFISDNCSSDDEEFNALNDWAIYPTTCGKVASPKISRTILFLDKYSDSSIRESMTKILKKLCTCLSMSRMTLDSGGLSDALLKIIESQLAVPTKQSNVLTAFRHMMDIEQGTMEDLLSKEECDLLLRYFQEGCELGNNLSRDDIQTLKRLPIFQDANENQLTSIDSVSNCHTISSCDLPKEELKSTLSAAGCILLRHNKMLELLYETLGVTPISTSEICLKYIFPNFDELNDETKIHYIEHIRDKVIPEASDEDKESLYSALRKISFIQDIHGQKHTTDYFYDPENNVFKRIISKTELLPKNYSAYKWRLFLNHIGLKHEVTRDMFIIFCKQIENKATSVDREEDYNLLVEQSKILVKELGRNQSLWNSSFLSEISGIRFIPSITIEKDLREIHPTFVSKQNHPFESFIAYRGAVPPRYKELAWSVAMILPSWAIPDREYPPVLYRGYCDIETIKVHQCLGIENDLIMSKVLQHIQRVCDHVAKRNAVEMIDTVPPKVRQTLMKVIKKMMKHLKDNLSKYKNEIKRRLYHTPICPVEEGSVLVMANQLIIDIEETKANRLRPYLFQAPRNLSDFDDVFRTLGAEKKATFDQLAVVLSKIKESCDSSGDEQQTRMHANERMVSHTVVHLLFTLLKESKGKCPISVTQLILPTSKDKLKPSTDLYFADDLKFEFTATALEFVVPLKQCGIEIEKLETDLMDLLPKQLRPHNIQEEMTENPLETNEVCPRGNDCPFFKHITNIITSEEMQRVLLRLLKHQSHDTKTFQKYKKQVEQLHYLDNFECVLKLETGQYDKNGQLLHKRPTSRAAFLHRSTVKIFIEHQDLEKPRRSLFGSLAGIINITCNLELDHEHKGHLREVLACKTVDELNEFLSKELDIPEYDHDDAIDQRNKSDQSKPGTIVEDDIRHLLVDDLYNLFHPDEIVAYKSPVEDVGSSYNHEPASNCDGPGKSIPDETEGNFVYAKILEEVREEGASPLHRKYRIDVGETNPIVVGVLKLFKFRRPRKPTETTIAIFEGDSESAAPLSPERDIQSPRDLQEATDRIREAIREFHTLSESEQKEAMRRLYKSWHPDKNPPEQSLLYNEAFKVLKEELERRGKEDTSSSIFRHYTSRYESWDSDIRREREQERTYQEKYRHEFGFNTSESRYDQSTSNSYVPPSFCSSTPDPQNARKWYRQAEKELCTIQEQIQNGIQTPWRTAFYLHQVAEIALKAAKFYQDGKPNKAVTDLLLLVTGISGSGRQNLFEKVAKLNQLGVDFHRPRYPDTTSSSMQNYSDFDEEGCLQICTEILHEVRDVIGIRPF